MAVRGHYLTPAADHYNRLLEDGALQAATVDALQEGARRHDLYFGDRSISVSLRPHFVERARWNDTVRASELICRALGKLEQELVANSELRRELDLNPAEEALVMAEPPCRHSAPSSRLDGFLADELRFVEYNAESPAGMAYNDKLVEVFDALPAMARLRDRFRVTPLPVQDRQWEVMVNAFREWARSDEPVVAIVDWQDVPTLKEQEMFKRQFESRGVATVMCDPRELELRSGRLWARGVAVNLVYRRILTTELLAKGAEASRVLCEAYRSGAACVINTFRAKLLHRKLSLGLLTDERCDHLFNAHELAAIQRHVPWTRKVREGPATDARRNRVPDFVEYVTRHRERLVLKPNDEYGGKGVVLGWTVTDGEWQAAIKAALDGSFVVQEQVPVPRAAFPVLGDGVTLEDLIVDTDPYLFQGRVGGCLTRLSSSALLNVTAGAGSVVPAYVVEGEA